MPYNYSDQQILDEVGSGRDAQRRRDLDALAAQARAGDQNALRRLYLLSDPDGPGGEGAATRDARNYGRFLLRDFVPQMEQAGFEPSAVGGYMEKGDGGGFWGSVKSVGGDLLRYGAPIAGAAIPGLGVLGGAALGAGGNAAGQLLKKGNVNVVEAGLGGLASGAGQHFVHGAKLPWGGGAGAGAAGTGTQSMPGVMGAAGGGGGGGGLLGGGGILGTGIDGGDIAKYGPLVLGGLGAYGAYQDQKKANELRERAMRLAENDWGSRDPLRQRVLGMAAQPEPQREDLSGLFADPGNPFYDRRRRM